MRPTVAVKRVSLRPQDRVGARVRRAPLPRGAAAAPSPASGGPVVLIEGVTCPSGHLNEPESATCGPCGARIDPAAPRVTRARPPLGVLVTDDGAVYTVTGDYVIGREPEQAPDVKAGTARALVLRDGERSTSRVHARLELSGWSVLLQRQRLRQRHVPQPGRSSGAVDGGAARARGHRCVPVTGCASASGSCCSTGTTCAASAAAGTGRRADGPDR